MLLKYFYTECFQFRAETEQSVYSDWLRGGRPRGRSSSAGRVKNVILFAASTLALGPTQSSIQWVPGALSLSGRCVKLTTHLQLVPSSRKRGSIHPLSHTSSWRNTKLVKQRDKFLIPFNFISTDFITEMSHDETLAPSLQKSSGYFEGSHGKILHVEPRCLSFLQRPTPPPCLSTLSIKSPIDCINMETVVPKTLDSTYRWNIHGRR
jgi:hypothetical protein